MAQEGESMSIQILVNNRVISTYNHEGDNYIEGRPGSEYTIRYTNPSVNKRKVVISVDGLNVITGDTTFESGYVVDGLGTVDIQGWRKDTNTVAKFKFGSRKNSYNSKNQNGIEGSIGVIGLREYNQVKQHKYPYIDHIWRWPLKDYYQRRINNDKWDDRISHEPVWSIVPLNGTKLGNINTGICYSQNTGYSGVLRAASSINNVGTEWGESATSRVETIYDEFEKTVACSPSIIYYDDSKGLAARGIILKKDTPFAKPNPFPTTKYCQEPT